MATWVIISGSPYGAGKCASTARQIANALKGSDSAIDATRCSVQEVASHDPDQSDRAIDVQVFTCADLKVHGCIGCNRCKENFTCIYQDDHQMLEEALAKADALIIISPIYFAGVPSQFKAILDRFQPYFWKRQQLIAEGLPIPSKRPLYIALVGEGGDPFGPEPAFASIASPLALTDFAPVYRQAFIRSDIDTITDALLEGIKNANQAIPHKPTVSPDSNSTPTHQEAW